MEVINTAELLFTVNMRSLAQYNNSQYNNLSSCSFFMNCLGKTELNLSLSFDTGRLRCYLLVLSSVEEPVELNYDIRLITAESKRNIDGVLGKLLSDKNHSSGFQYLTTREDILDDSNIFFFGDALKVSCRLWSTSSDLSSPFTLFAQSRAGIPRVLTWVVEQFSKLSTDKLRRYVLPGVNKEDDDIAFVLFLHQDEVNIRFDTEFNGSLLMESVSIVLANGDQEICWEGQEFLEPFENSYLSIIKKCKINKNTAEFLSNDTLTLIFRFIDYCNYSLCYPSEMIEGPIPVPREPSRDSLNLQDRYTSPPSLQTLKVSTNAENPKLEDASAGPFSPEGSHSMVDDFSALLEKGTFSDFILRVDQESIPAHKAVLCARSPVFEAMLTSPMLESTENETKVPDFTPDSVRRLLRFLYTGSVPDVDPDNAVELYSLADKYAVLELRNQCSSVLSDNLCTRNIGRVLLLSDRHADKTLKTRVVDFIQENEEDVLRSPQWRTFMIEEPLLALAVIYDINLKRFGS